MQKAPSKNQHRNDYVGRVNGYESIHEKQPRPPDAAVEQVFPVPREADRTKRGRGHENSGRPRGEKEQRPSRREPDVPIEQRRSTEDPETIDFERTSGSCRPLRWAITRI